MTTCTLYHPLTRYLHSLSLTLSLSLTQSRQEHSLSLHSHPRRYKVGFNGNNSSKGSFDEINLCENISQSHNNNNRGNKAFKSYLSRNPGPLVMREELWVRIPVPQAGCFSFISSKNDFCLERRINGIKRPFKEKCPSSIQTHDLLNMSLIP